MENFSKKIEGKIVFELGEDTELGHLQMNFKNIIEKKVMLMDLSFIGWKCF